MSNRFLLALLMMTVWCAAAMAAPPEAGEKPPATRGEAPREGAPREGPPREGAPRGDAPREGAPREGAPRGDRDPAAAPREGEPRGDRAGAPREGPPRGERAGRGAGPFEQLTGLTAEQRTKLQDIRKKYEEMRRQQHEEEMAVLTDAQRKEFEEKMNQRNPRGRDGDRPQPPEGKRDGDRPAPREGARDGDRPAPREGDRPAPREGAREGDRPAPREGDRPAPRDGARDGDQTAPREGAREGGREGAREAGARSAAEVTIMRVDAPSVGIKVPSGDSTLLVTVTTDEKTAITLDGKPATLANLKEGMRAIVVPRAEFFNLITVAGKVVNESALSPVIRIDAHAEPVAATGR